MITYLITALIVIVISYLWAQGISDMNENHKDYDGKDFLNEN